MIALSGNFAFGEDTPASATAPLKSTPPAQSAVPRSLMTRQGVIALMRPLGFDDPSILNWDALSLGLDKNFLILHPVGSVENPFTVNFPFGQIYGWKVEQLLPVSDEQVKSLQILRKEYEAEKEKIAQELIAFNQATASKLRTLRQQYEERANELLPEEQRKIKLKLDALRREMMESEKAAAETGEKQLEQSQTAFILLNQVLAKLILATDQKLQELLPAEGKAKIEQTMKQQASILDIRINGYSRSPQSGPASGAQPVRKAPAGQP
jgi:hypothetical protein